MKRPVFLQKIYSQKDLINPWGGMPVRTGCVAILSVIEGIKSSLRPNSNPLQMNWGLSTIACPKFDSVAPEMPSGQSSGLTLRKKTLFLPLQPPNRAINPPTPKIVINRAMLNPVANNENSARTPANPRNKKYPPCIFRFR